MAISYIKVHRPSVSCTGKIKHRLQTRNTLSISTRTSNVSYFLSKFGLTYRIVWLGFVDEPKIRRQSDYIVRVVVDGRCMYLDAY